MLRSSILAVLVAGCSSIDSVFVGGPPEGGGSSAIIAIEHHESLELHAARLPFDGPIELEALDVERGDRIEIRALVYDETLDELGIAEGPLRLVDPESREGRKLPGGARVLGTTIDGDLEIGEWAAVEMGQRLIEARIPVGAFACTTFDLHDLTPELDDRGIRATRVAAAKDHLLIFGSDRSLHAVESGRFAALGSLSATVSAAAVDRDGAVWFATSSGIQRAVIGSSGIEEVSSILDAPAAPVADLASGVEDGAIVVYAATKAGEIRRSRDGVWSTVATRPGTRWSRMRWIEPEHVMLVDFGFRLFDLRSATLSEIFVDQGIGVYDVAATPGLGPVIGTSDGRILGVRDDGFEALIPEAQGFVTLAVTRYKGGAMFILSSGFVGEVQPRTEPCALIQAIPISWGAALYTVGPDVYGTALATVELIPVLFRLSAR